jgi:hypothetical protein
VAVAIVELDVFAERGSVRGVEFHERLRSAGGTPPDIRIAIRESETLKINGLRVKKWSDVRRMARE